MSWAAEHWLIGCTVELHSGITGRVVAMHTGHDVTTLSLYVHDRRDLHGGRLLVPLDHVAKVSRE